MKRKRKGPEKKRKRPRKQKPVREKGKREKEKRKEEKSKEEKKKNITQEAREKVVMSGSAQSASHLMKMTMSGSSVMAANFGFTQTAVGTVGEQWKSWPQKHLCA